MKYRIDNVQRAPRVEIVKEDPWGSLVDSLSKSIDRVTSPEYLKAQAEMDLSRKKFDFLQQQYDDSQLDKIKERAIEGQKFGLEEKKYALEEEDYKRRVNIENYERLQEEINTDVNYYTDHDNISELLNLDTDLHMMHYKTAIDKNKNPIYSPFQIETQKRRLDNLKKKKNIEWQNAQGFANNYNIGSGAVKMTAHDALRVMDNPELYEKHLKMKYFSTGDLSERENKRLDYLIQALSSNQISLNKLVEQDSEFSQLSLESASGQALFAQHNEAKKNLKADIARLEKQIVMITGGAGGGVSLGDDPFIDSSVKSETSTTDEFSPTIDLTKLYGVFEDKEDIVNEDSEIARDNAEGRNVLSLLLSEAGQYGLLPTTMPLGTEPSAGMKTPDGSRLNVAMANQPIELPEEFREEGGATPELFPNEINQDELTNRDTDIDILPDEVIQPEPTPEDFEGLPTAPGGNIDSLNKLNIKDNKGVKLNTENKIKFESQLKSMYNSVMRRGALSDMGVEKYLQLNKDLLNLLVSGTALSQEPTKEVSDMRKQGKKKVVANRMQRIIPNSIERFLSQRKINKDALINRLKENIRNYYYE